MTLRITELPDKTVEIYELSEEGGTQVVCNCTSVPQALEIGSTYT